MAGKQKNADGGWWRTDAWHWLFFTLFWWGIVGLIIENVAATAYRVYDAQRRFLTTDGVVTGGEAKEMPGGGRRSSPSYIPLVGYDYVVNGKPYHSSLYRFDGVCSRCNREDVTAILAKHPVGAKVAVYYDPRRPEIAVLCRDMPEGLAALMFFLQVFIVPGIVLAVGTVLRFCDYFRRRRSSRCMDNRPLSWYLPDWGILRQESGGAFVLRGGGRWRSAAMAFAMGYGITCFLTVFFAIFWTFCMSRTPRESSVPPAIAFAFVIGIISALYAWGKDGSKVTLVCHPARGMLMLAGGPHLEPVNLRFADVKGFKTRTVANTGRFRNQNAPTYLVRLSLVAASSELKLHDFQTLEDAVAARARMRELIRQPV